MSAGNATSNDLAPRLAPGVEITPALGPDGKAVISLPSGRFFDVSPQTALLLSLIDGERDIPTLAALLSARTAPPIGADDLRELIERSLVPTGLICFGVETSGDGTRARAEAPRSKMWLRVPFIPERVVNACAGGLTMLFRPAVAAALGALALGTHAWFYFAGPHLELHRELFHVAEWLPPALIFQLSVFAHELGHAAALRHFGERPGAIGFGFYRIFPVFFTDVSRAWRLPRTQRAVVDAGGMYVQVVFAAALIALNVAARSPALARAAALVDLSLIANLNPFLRWDGYWLAIDLSGIRDLRGRSMAFLRSWLTRRTGSAEHPSLFIATYAVLSLIYFTALGLWLALVAAPRIVREILAAWRALSRARTPGAALAPAAFVIAGAIALAAIALFLWTGTRGLASSLGRGEGSRES